MANWEYLTVLCDWVGAEIKPRFINQVQNPQYRQGPHLSAYLNEVGAQGWELVTSHHLQTNVGNVLLILKRPREQVVEPASGAVW